MSMPTHSDLIDALGGTTAVARLFSIQPPSVHEWRKKGIPDDKLIRLAPTLEEKGIATRRDLFPDDFGQIWPELRPEAPAHA